MRPANSLRTKSKKQSASYWPDDFQVEVLRNALITKYILRKTGNLSFLERLGEMAQDFCPAGVAKKGADQTHSVILLDDPSPERAIHGARTLILRAYLYSSITNLLRNDESPGTAELARYVAEIEELAHSYGLRPTTLASDWWGYGYLHYLVSREMQSLTDLGYSAIERGFLSPRPYSWSGYSKRFTIEWERGEESDKAATQAYILREFRKQWDQGNQELKECGFSPVERRQLDKHIHLLYCRICPQPPLGRPQGWSCLAHQEHCSVKQVSRVVKELADKLDLALPRLCVGRPPSSAKTT